jgi:hypothetical protein
MLELAFKSDSIGSESQKNKKFSPIKETTQLYREGVVILQLR